MIIDARAPGTRCCWRSAATLHLVLAAAVALSACSSGLDVLTQRNDNMRTGATSWPGLNQTSVKTFQLLHTLPVDAPVLAQPLFLKSIQFRGTGRSMVWVATVTNKLYPFNADPPFEQLGPVIDLGAPYTPSASDLACCLPNESLMTYVNGHPMIGIESTPVIDGARNLMFVSYRVNARLGGEQRVAAINLSTGEVWRSVAVPGTDVWHKIHRNRMSLLLDRGIVFVGYSAVNEFPRKGDYAKSYQGWIHAFDARTLIHLGAWRSVRDQQNGGDPLNDSLDGGGLWQASTAPAADGQGSLFFATGNGAKSPQPPDGQGQNLSNAVVRLQVDRVPVRAPNATGNPASMVSSHQQHIFYRAGDGSMQHIFWTDYEPPGQLRHDNWTQKAEAPAAAGDPATMVYGNQQHVFYRATDGSIRHLFWGPDAPANTIWTDDWTHLPDHAAMHPADWFVPYRKIWQDTNDMDLGAGGVVLIPGTPYMVQSGKEGILYLLNRRDMGKFDASPPVDKCPVVPADENTRDHVAQKFVAGTNRYVSPDFLRPCGSPPQHSGDWMQWPHVHGTPAFGDFGSGQAFLYVWPEKDALKSFRWLGNAFDTQWNDARTLSGAVALAPPWKDDKNLGKVGQNGMPGGMLSLTVDPTRPRAGVLFASVKTCGDSAGWKECSLTLCGSATKPACVDQDRGMLRAFDPLSLRELWNDQVSTNANLADRRYNFARFVPPTIGNGRVFIATASNKVLVYGNRAP